MNQEHYLSCPSCGKKCRIPTDFLGKRAGCPRCRKPIQIQRTSPTKNPKANYSEITNYALNVAELRRFISPLPDREVIVRFPYNSITLTMDDVRRSLAGKRDEDFIFDHSNWFVVSKAECTDGWMQLTFGWRYWIYYFELGTRLTGILDSKTEELISSSIGLANAQFRNGIEYDHAMHHLTSLTYCEELLVDKVGRDSPIVNLLSDPIELFRAAVNIWREDPGYIRSQIIGGGFGIVGAVKGIAVAQAVNSIIGWRNRVVENRQLSEIDSRLEYAFHQLCSTRGLLTPIEQVND